MSKKTWAQGMLTLCAMLFVLPVLTWKMLAASPGGIDPVMALCTSLVASLGLLILLVVLLGPLIIGRDRDRMGRLFGIWARSVLALIAVDVLAQAILFVYAVVYRGQTGAGGVPAVVLFAVLAVGLIGCGVLLQAALSSFREAPLPVRALEASRNEHPRLFDLIDSIALKLGIEPPHHVVVGLEPTFFVTNQGVRAFKQDEPLRGQTLYLSATLMRVLGTEQVAAIVGHELGHFKGQDLLYSTRFAPTYQRFMQSLQLLAEPTKFAAVNLLKLPLVRSVEACFLTFATSVRAVGRERELEADRVAASVTAARTVASALVQTSLWVPAWQPVMQSSLQGLGQGARFENMSEAFEAVCRHNSTSLNPAEVGKALTAVVQPHPVDTHPSLGQRLEALGVGMEEVMTTELTPQPAMSLLDGAEAIERELTKGEVLWLCARTGIDPATMTRAITIQPADGKSVA